MQRSCVGWQAKEEWLQLSGLWPQGEKEMDKGQKIVTNKASAERGEKQLEPQDNLKKWASINDYKRMNYQKKAFLSRVFTSKIITFMCKCSTACCFEDTRSPSVYIHLSSNFTVQLMKEESLAPLPPFWDSWCGAVCAHVCVLFCVYIAERSSIARLVLLPWIQLDVNLRNSIRATVLLKNP